MYKLKSTKLPVVLLSCSLFGCAIDHANYVKNMDKLSTAEYSKIHVGKPQNFTAVNIRFFDRLKTHETSGVDLPKVQAQMSNMGNKLYYSDNISGKEEVYIEQPKPDGLLSDWDKFAVLDIKNGLDLPNYVALGMTTAKSGESKIDDVDYTAQITDSGATVEYSDWVKGKFFNKTIFKQQPKSPTLHSSIDKFYLSDDGKFKLFKSTKYGKYRFAVIDVEGTEKYLDFEPMTSGLQSTKNGFYRGIMYSLGLQKWMTVDYVPTKKLICLDLAKAYDAATNNRNQSITRAAIMALAIAAGGNVSASINGNAQSDVNGYFRGKYFTVNQNTNYSASVSAYDYSYLAQGTVFLLDTIFKGNADVDTIKTAIEQQQCGFEV